MGTVCAMALACAADEPSISVAGVPTLAGQWSVVAVAVKRPDRSVLGGQLTMSPDRSWRLRYDYRGQNDDQVWSDGLSGWWVPQPGEPRAVRFEVVDDRSTGTGVLRHTHVMDVSFAEFVLRLVRTPE
jgi:hypothetical protein